MEIKKLLCAGIFIYGLTGSLLAQEPTPPPAEQLPAEKWLTFKMNVQSDHPYSSYTHEKTPIQIIGAKKIKLHFDFVDLDDGTKNGTPSNCDSIDVGGVQKIVGIHPDPFWSDAVEGETLILKVDTCYNSSSSKGYKIDQVAIQL